MTYVINNYDGSPFASIEDGSAITNLDITLVGKNFPNYGAIVNENFLYLLQNFAKGTSPSRPTTGQLWFDTSENRLKVMNMESGWSTIGTPEISDTQPVNPSLGGFWFDTMHDKLYVYDGTSYKFVGPQTTKGHGLTRFESLTVVDNNNNNRQIICGYVDDEVVTIISKENFVLNSIPGFGYINKGINLSDTSSMNATIHGTVDFANKLKTSRKINGVDFDGSADITIRNSQLIPGNHISGTAYDGTAPITWGVDATPVNVANTIVSRDDTGSFYAVNINANFNGNLTGNVTGNVKGNLIASDSSIVFSADTKQFTGTKFTGAFYGDLQGKATTADASNAIKGGTANALVYQTGANTTGFIPTPTVSDSYLQWDGSQFVWNKINISTGTGSGSNTGNGTLTSVGLSAPSLFKVSGSPITTSGTLSLTFNDQNKNTFLAGPTSASGTPEFRTISASDIPTLNQDTTGTSASVAGGTANSILYQTSTNTTSFIPAPSSSNVYLMWTGSAFAWASGTGTGTGGGTIPSIQISKQTAIVFLYKRSSTTPLKPSKSVKYTFSAKSVQFTAGETNLWSPTIPSGTDPLYVITATAYNQLGGDTDDIDVNEWADPVIMVSNGINTATVYLYKRTENETIPAKPSGSFDYDFANKTLTAKSGASLNGWSRELPLVGGSYRWMIFATSSAGGSTDEIPATEWSAPAILSQDGADAPPSTQLSKQTAIVYLYKRSSTTPLKPSKSVKYTFSAKSVQFATNETNLWSPTIPSGADPLYVITATAYNQLGGDTDDIDVNEWADPVIMVSNGINSATVYLYKRTDIASPAPTKPSGSFDYDFTQKTLTARTGASLNGWTRELPASGGSYRWVIFATASSGGSTDEIPATEWSTQAILSQDGTDASGTTTGVSGKYQVNQYAKSTSVTTSPTTGWQDTVPTVEIGYYLWQRVGYVTPPSKIPDPNSWSAGYRVSGPRGSQQFNVAIPGKIWTTPNSSIFPGGEVVLNDTVTEYNTTEKFTETRFWDGYSWARIDQVIDGNLLVAGSIGANKLSVSDLSAVSANLGTIVVTGANIKDGTITNGKIGDYIQSVDYAWGPTQYKGWKIDKSGTVVASAIEIRDSAGNILLKTTPTSTTLAASIDNSKITADSLGAVSQATLTSSLADKLSTNATSVMGAGGGIFTGNLSVSGSTYSGSGVAITTGGIVAYKNGAPTFTLNNDGGSGTFSGTLSAATGSFGDLTVADGGNIKIGKTSDSDGTPGFWLGKNRITYNDGTSRYAAKFNLGDSSNNLIWDGQTFKINMSAGGGANILMDGAAAQLKFNYVDRTRVTLGKLGPTEFGILASNQDGVELFKLSDDKLTIKGAESSLNLFGATYKNRIILSGDYVMNGTGTSVVQNIPIPIPKTTAMYRVYVQGTVYWDPVSLPKYSQALCRYFCNGVYYDKYTNKLVDMGEQNIRSDSTNTDVMPGDRMNTWFDPATQTMNLQLISRGGNPIGGKTYFSYTVYLVDNYRDPFNKY